MPAEINTAEAALENLQREVQPVDQQGAVQNEPAEAVAQVNAVRNSVSNELKESKARYFHNSFSVNSQNMKKYGKVSTQ